MFHPQLTPEPFKSSRFQVVRVDSIAKFTQVKVSPSEMKNQEVFHYSIPEVQISGTGKLEQGNDIDSDKWKITQNCVLISKLNPRKSTLCLASPQDKLTVSSTEFINLATGNALDNKFLLYVLQSDIVTRYLDSRTLSATRSHQRVTPHDITAIGIPWPDKSKRTKIVEQLDQELAAIDGLIADQLKRKELLKEQFEAKKEQVILEAGGQEVRLSRVLKGLKDGTHGTHPRVSSGGEVLLSAKNISSGELVISEDESRISLEEAAQITASGFPQKGDVMMILVGATYGRTSLYKLDQTLPFQRSVGFFRPNEKLITSDYLKLVMSSHKFQQQLSLGIKTSAQPGIYLGDVASCMINLPKRDSQLSAAKKYHSAEKIYNEIIADIDKSIENLIELRSSLLSTTLCS